MPGGVNSPVRAMRSIGRDPIFVEHGEGAELVDVDGNRYVDWVMSWGPLIAGHAHPNVVAAVTEAARRGTSYGAPTQGEVDLAGEVTRRVPSAEMVRMTSSGTEATMSAVRLARAATGRDAVVKFAGAYHGHVDGLLADAGSGLATQGIPASPGVTAGQAAGTIAGPRPGPAGGLGALARPDAAACERLERPPERLATGLGRAAADAGVAVSVPRTPGLVTVFFSAEPVRDLDGARACDMDAHAGFC